MKIMRLETSNHSLRIGMILSFLNLSSHDFILGLLPQKSAYLTVYAYQLIIFPIFIRYGTLSAHSTILLSNKVLLSLPSNHDFVSFTALGHTPYVKHRLLWAQDTIFCLASTHLVLIPLVTKPHGPFPIYIGMLLSILGLNSHGFFYEHFPQKSSYQLNVAHAYKLISLPISN